MAARSARSLALNCTAFPRAFPFQLSCSALHPFQAQRKGGNPDSAMPFDLVLSIKSP
jgi:hypothetical protein